MSKFLHKLGFHYWELIATKKGKGGFITYWRCKLCTMTKSSIVLDGHVMSTYYKG